ncbi:PREDICTED: protein terminal ear1 homolog [Camelina sativa]|uniref:Protein terminal ear1 homolog n=1 Tax=Camelina sativa TaxID=90675 RepID=A0ABM0ZDJ8_CAMSA|nr:PREDICTED: protein terminal ear1 homolog [Camelina sativa]
MEDSRIFPFARNLDPRAQEFIPLNPISSHFYFPYTSPPPPPLPPPLPPSSYGLSPTEPRVFTFFNLPPHPMMFSSPPPPQPQPLPPPRPCFSGVSAAQRPPTPSNSPTRSLSLISVPRDVTESTVRRDLEVFGDVRGVQMERISEGIVTVHFYDIRDAKRAVRDVCGRHMQQQARLSGSSGGGGGGGNVWSSPSSSSSARGFVSGRHVWAQFVVPATSAVPGGCNQGTLVIFNLDPEVSSIDLRQIFQVYGPIKELRETPYKKHQRFVEFYDVRDAARAFDRMNGEEIGGKQVVIEFSRPGGLKNRFRSSRLPQLPFQPLQPPPILNPPYLRQSVTLMKDKNKIVSPSNGVIAVNASMRSLSIIDDVDNKTRGAESECAETKSKNMAKWGKKRQMKNMELSQFLISEETMEDPSCRDPRTTLMIKNIPNKYSQKLLLDMLDKHCIHINEGIAEDHHEHESLHQPFSSYDFVYLPMDFNNKCNVGYGFVNMTSPEAAWRFYKAFNHQRWEVFNSRKICQITYARVQGLEDLKEHFKSSKFPCEAELYLPVVFSPPRDGKQLPEPVSININGCIKLNHSRIEQMDGQDHSESGSCCDSDHDNSHEDGFSGSSVDEGRSFTVEGETSF